jgi:signal transduction histidine kinase
VISAALARDFNQMADHINAMLSSQRQLVSDVSHELRSPLARLRIALELAQRKGDHSDALPRIEKEADELENLVTHLLSLARIESGQFQLERQFTDMTDLLNQIVRDANFEGEQKTCSIRLLSTGTVSLNIDRVLIRAAIENVIRNAIRHSPPDSEIVVSTLASDSEFRIIIDDNGPGVPEAALDKLFQPFARVGQSRDRVSGGFGLGLAITGRNLLAHGGQVYAQNRDVGGLRVVLGLPM